MNTVRVGKHSKVAGWNSQCESCRSEDTSVSSGRSGEIGNVPKSMGAGRSESTMPAW